MIWLDFFLQAFIQALAWCLAFTVTAALMFGAAYAVLAVYGRLPVRRSGR